MKCIQIFLFVLFSLNLQAQAVYKTSTGKKYHLETCKVVNNVSQKLSVKKAIELGLTACKICNPPSGQLNFKSQPNKAKGQATTVQCKGQTKSGTRCKHRTSIANGYCFQHNPDKHK